MRRAGLRRASFCVGLFVLAALLPSAASASAARLQVHGQAASVETGSGAVQGLGMDAVMALSAPLRAELSITADAVEGTLFVTERRFHALPGARVPDGETTTEAVPVIAQRLSLRANAPDAHMAWRVQTEGRTDHAHLLDGRLDRNGQAARLFPTVDPGSSVERGLNRHTSLFTQAGAIPAQFAGARQYTGPLEWFAWSIDARYEQGREPTTVSAGRTLSSHGLDANANEIERWLHFQGRVVNMSIPGEAGLLAWLQAATLRPPPGRIVVSGVSGTLDWAGQTRTLSSSVIEASSDDVTFTMSTRDAPADRFTLSISGAAEEVWVDGVALTAPRPASNAAAITVWSLVASLLAGTLVWLARGAGLPFLSRRTRQGAYGPYLVATVSNPLRRRTLDLIRSTPGIQAYHVWKAVGGAAGVTLRNLDRLERTGFVRSLLIGRYRHYFLNGQDQSADAHVQALLATRAGGETYVALRELGPASQRALAQRLSISMGAVSTRLRHLREFGLAERMPGARGRYRALCGRVADEFWSKRAPPAPMPVVAAHPAVGPPTFAD